MLCTYLRMLYCFFTYCSSTISITLVQGDINSTINFTVRYRGDNLAAPVLSYNTTGNHMLYTYVGSLLTLIIVMHT